MNYRALSGYLLVFILVLLFTPLLGAEPLSLSEIIDNWDAPVNTGREILLHYRLPRTILCLLCGGALAMAGASFQAIFNNPLVEPYTLGVAGGAAVGAYLAIAFPTLSIYWGVFGSQQILALLGAFLVMFMSYQVAAKQHHISPQTLLLGGLTISIICSGFIVLLSYISSPHQLAQVQRWMLGGFDYAGFSAIFSLLPFFLPGVGLLLYFSPALNVLNLGEEAAQGLGVDTKTLYISVFAGGGLVTGAVVSIAGPIAFIGLITPHFVRRLSGYDQRLILPGSFLLGGSVLAISDMLARSSMRLICGSPTEFPAGIITALIGGPLFIHMLYRSSRS